MKEIKDKIVFSDDIERILRGINAFDYKYDVRPSKGVIKDLRRDFCKDVSKIFAGKVAIVSEEEMLEVNNLIRGDYPHCIFG